MNSATKLSSVRRLRRLALLTMIAAATGGCKEEPKPTPAAPPPPAVTPAAELPKGSEGVAFARKARAVGEKREETSDMRMKMEITVDMGNGKSKTSSLETTGVDKRNEEVLAVSGDAPSKLRVTFAEKSEKTKEGEGKERAKKSAIAGKTYVVDATGAKLAVTDEKGKAAPSAEAKEVEKAYTTLGKADPIAAAMPATPIKPGDAVPAMAKALQEEISAKADGMVVSDATVVFKEAVGDLGVFDVGFTLSKDEGPMSMKINMKGPVRVSKTTGQPMAMELTGPVAISAKSDGKAKVKMDGKGEMSLAVHSK